MMLIVFSDFSFLSINSGSKFSLLFGLFRFKSCIYEGRRDITLITTCVGWAVVGRRTSDSNWTEGRRPMG